MKKLLLILCLICLPAMAEENKAEQTQTVEDNKAVFALAKTPTNAEVKQTQVVKNNWFSIVIICNGKIPFEKSTDK